MTENQSPVKDGGLMPGVKVEKYTANHKAAAGITQDADCHLRTFHFPYVVCVLLFDNVCCT